MDHYELVNLAVDMDCLQVVPISGFQVMNCNEPIVEESSSLMKVSINR